MKAKKLCQSLYNMSTEYRNNKLIQDKQKIVKKRSLFRSAILYNKYDVRSNVLHKVNQPLQTFLIHQPCFGSPSRGELVFGLVAKMWRRPQHQVGEEHEAQESHQRARGQVTPADHHQHWQTRVGGGPWLFQESLHPDNREPGNIWK